MSEPITRRTPSPPTWCDGTPHSPTAIPPLPFHDWRWMGDDPYIECAGCGQINGHDGRVIRAARGTTPARVLPDPASGD